MKQITGTGAQGIVWLFVRALPLLFLLNCVVGNAPPASSVEETPPPAQSAVPTAGETVSAKTSSPQQSIDFTLTSTNSGVWKVYYSANGGSPLSTVSASFNLPVLTLAAADGNILATTYYVSVTENGRLESARLALTVEPYTAPPPPPPPLDGSLEITLAFGGIPGDPVSVSGPAAVSKTAGTLRIAVDGAAAFSRFEWLLDGAVQTAQNSGFYDIALSALGMGQHRVTVIAWKGGIPYSARAAFLVTP